MQPRNGQSGSHARNCNQLRSTNKNIPADRTRQTPATARQNPVRIHAFGIEADTVLHFSHNSAAQACVRTRETHEISMSWAPEGQTKRFHAQADQIQTNDHDLNHKHREGEGRYCANINQQTCTLKENNCTNNSIRHACSGCTVRGKGFSFIIITCLKFVLAAPLVFWRFSRSPCRRVDQSCF